MEEFLNYLIPKLVEDKKKVDIVKTEQNGTIVFLIKVAKKDMGQLIGKGGKIINSIRNLIKVLAVKEKKKVTLQLDEPQE